MNTTVIILLVAGILGLLFFLLLHIYGLKKEKKRSEAKQLARKIAARMNTVITNKEIINNQFIGIDISKQSILFSKHIDNKSGLTSIPLSSVGYYQLQTESEELIHRGRNRTVSEKLLSRISLRFFSTTRILLFEMVFFDHFKNGFDELPYLRKRAEYWKKIIKQTGAIEMTW